ncbi:amidohydrolase [Microbacterium sp. W4I4]|uniref:M20/M25/M40 family metallo-hydrolase n=1 Tax=Microbacterium sp. W4I4 TaxID=3042295 RepID=UPI0027842880|nr:M20/M25/M40 family metallo-hydrolase [Microbacterium sp. W4I4]MDQ0612783.1 amidohydrolase [Microbacterium sp. W4I4]
MPGRARSSRCSSPAEETGDGARGMLEDGLADAIPHPDVALGQHVLVGPSGTVNTRVGPILSSADSVRITVHGRGGHGSMPQNTVDPVILAAFIAVRLQTIVSRELPPSEPAVLTVGSIRAGTKSNIIPDDAILELNLRTYTMQTRERMLAAIERIARAESVASGAPKEPEIEVYDSFPLTSNDEAVTTKLAAAFREHFGDQAGELPLQTASEDFSDIPTALGVPYSYWGIGGTDPELWSAAVEKGTVESDIPGNHSPLFLPVIQPTLQTGTAALIVAAGAWLGRG